VTTRPAAPSSVPARTVAIFAREMTSIPPPHVEQHAWIASEVAIEKPGDAGLPPGTT